MRLGELISAGMLREQMEHVRGLRFRRSELVWLAGNTFYGTRSIFEPAFLEWLENDFRLSDYEISEDDGQLMLRFSGLWTEVTMWEVYGLALVSEMKTRAALSTLNELELDVLYARAKTKLWEKVERLRAVPEVRISEFGTRRRHSFLWQEYVVQVMRVALGASLSGTSNTFLAYKHDLEAMGTNAHELPMAMAALADDDEELHRVAVSRAGALAEELWRRAFDHAAGYVWDDAVFGGCAGLGGGLDGAAVRQQGSVCRGDEYIAWLKGRGRDAKKKRLIASDGLDAEDILRLYEYFHGRIRFSAGWGTLLTNDFRGCHPRGEMGLEPISLVCKLMTVEGRPAVKLSDNARKATGPQEEIERYRRVFGSVAVEGAVVTV